MLNLFSLFCPRNGFRPLFTILNPLRNAEKLHTFLVRAKLSENLIFDTVHLKIKGDLFLTQFYLLKINMNLDLSKNIQKLWYLIILPQRYSKLLGRCYRFKDIRSDGCNHTIHKVVNFLDLCKNQSYGMTRQLVKMCLILSHGHIILGQDLKHHPTLPYTLLGVKWSQNALENTSHSIGGDPSGLSLM